MAEDRGRTGMGRMLAALAASAALAVPAWAQTVPDDAILAPRGADDFRIRQDGTVAPPAPAPAPTPTPTPAPDPAPTPAPAPTDPAPAPVEPSTTAETAPEAAAPAAEGDARRTQRRVRTQRRTVERQAPAVRRRAVQAPAPETARPSSDEVLEAEAPPAVAPPATTVRRAPPPTESAPEPERSWLPWAGLLGLGALAGAFALARRRRTSVVVHEEEQVYEEEQVAEPEPELLLEPEQIVASPAAEHVAGAEPEAPVRTLPVVDLPPVMGAAPAAEVAPLPVVAPEPQELPVASMPVGETQAEAPAPVVPVAATPRPHLALAFDPAVASATDAQASVQFVLTVSNLGDAPARRVRMEARMFAMGEDHDAALAAFFAEPLARETPIASAIPQGISTELRTQVTLPRAAVRPIRHADRVLFVPVVAVNVLYEWEDGAQGQTAMSYVIGRENRPPSPKMAPFRLDQGPRVYREVGHRPHELRRVA